MNVDPLFPEIFWVSLSQGDRGFPFIRGQGGIASLQEVMRIKQACETHLAVLSQEEIDDHNTEVREQQRREAQEESRRPIEKKPPRAGFIYLLKNNRNGFVKIGFSKNPKARERTLQSEEPDVTMLFSFAAVLPDEERLHEEFSSKRIRGEWFALTTDDIEQIKGRAA